MRVRGVTLLVFGLLGVGVALFVVWQYRTLPDRARARMRREHRQETNARPLTPDEAERLNRMAVGMRLDPLLFSTLATQIGPYTLSLRNIRDTDGTLDLLGPYAGIDRPLGRFHVSFQVLSDLPNAERRCVLNAETVSAQDDTGHRIRAIRSAVPGTPLPNGWFHVVLMEEPAATAHALTFLAGTLMVADASGKMAPHPFRLIGIPLPNGPRVYGRMAPRWLTAAAAQRLPPGLTVLTGAEALEAARRSRSMPVSTVLPPQRLLFAPGQPAHLGRPTPADPNPLTITVRPGPYGSIPLEIVQNPRADASAGQGAQRWRGEVWEDDPLMIVLPQDRPGERRALAVRLSRELVSFYQSSEVPAMFPALPGHLGGAIATSVRVGERSFGQGTLEVHLWRRSDSAWGKPQTLRISLSIDGTFVLPNLEPGEYRMERPVQGLSPPLPPGEPPVPLDVYLKHRFGAAAGVWQGERVPSILVRPGQKTDAPPLQWFPLSRSQSTGAPRDL